MFHKGGPLRIVFLEIQDVINKFPVSSSLSIVLFGFMKNLALHLGRSPLIHSYSYELAGDNPTCVAKFPINSKSFIKHPGGTPHV